MAQIDPTIALGIKPPQFQNPLELYAQQAQMREAENRNALAKYQMAKAQRDDEAANALDAAWKTSGGDRAAFMSQVPGRMVPDVMKKFGDVDKQKADIEKTQTDTAKHRLELFGGALVAAMQDPSDAVLLQNFQALKAAGIPIDEIAQKMLAIPDLEQRRQQIKSFAFGSEVGRKALEAIQPKAEKMDTNSQIGFVNVNPLGGQVGSQMGTAIQKTETPDSIASRQVTMRGQNMTDARQRDALAQSQSHFEQTQGKEKPLTEAQGKATLYLGMMRDGEKAIAASGFNPASPVSQVDLQAARGDIPFTPKALQNLGASKEAQVYAQGAFQWSEAMLRQLTGANAPEPEVWRNAKTYFPMPGDSPEVIKRKNEARAQIQRHIETLAASGAAQVAAKEGPATAAPAGGKKISTDAEYRALKPGEQYIAPDGTTRTKR